MFIYIKTDKEQNSRYVINQVCEGDIYYYELCFNREPSPYELHKALKHCKRQFPIVYDGRMKKREEARRLDAAPYDLQLLINAFSFVSMGQKKALVIDPDGLLCDKIARPLISVRTLYVFTKRADIYTRAGDMHLKQIGSSPVLIGERIDIGEYPTLLSPFGYRELEKSHPFTFGKNGLLPEGEGVTARGHVYDRRLSAALFCISGDKKSAAALPLLLRRDGCVFPLESVKVRLDSTSRNSI